MKDVMVPRPIYGRGLLKSLPEELFREPLVLTQPEPWELVSSLFPSEGTQKVFVQTMERSVLDKLSSSVGRASAVLGIGGGSSVDCAKFFAWKKRLPLVLIPTILSVDAPFTKAIAVREQGCVRYVGEVFPDYLLIDFDLLEKAPPILNKAGVGDILSIYTALWDWKEAHERLGEPYDEGVAKEANEVLRRLFAGADEIALMTEHGLRLLADLFIEEVTLCEMVRKSRPEEGSEHYIAYCIEYLTRRSYTHGLLVSLGCLVAGVWQGQDIGTIKRFLKDIDLGVSLRSVGITKDELRLCLLGMKDFLTKETQLLPGVFHFRESPSPEDVERIIEVAGLSY